MGYKWDIFKTNIEMDSIILKDHMENVGKKAASGLKKGSKYLWDNKEVLLNDFVDNAQKKSDNLMEMDERAQLKSERMTDEEIEYFLESMNQKIKDGKELRMDEKMLAKHCKEIYKNR